MPWPELARDRNNARKCVSGKVNRMESVQPLRWGAGGAGIGTTMADMKLKIAEHLINLADFYRQDGVYSIMAETKVGARRRSDLVNKLRVVFSLS